MISHHLSAKFYSGRSGINRAKDTKQRFDVDPVLEKISRDIPDDEIDLLFPFRNFNIQGRKRTFKTSQLYSAHILTMIKEVTSFNKLHAEFKS